MGNGLVLTAATMLIVSAAGSAAAADNKDPAKKKDDSQKVVCKTEDTIGSMIPKRVCMTRADWERRRAEDKEYLDAQPFRRDQIDAPQVTPGG
jgi:hypothetical protein